MNIIIIIEIFGKFFVRFLILVIFYLQDVGYTKILGKYLYKTL